MTVFGPHREKVRGDLTVKHTRAKQLSKRGPALVAEGNQLVNKMVDEVQQTMSVAMGNIISKLSTMVDGYQANFDPTDLGTYRAGLYEYMDQQLVAEMNRVSTAALGKAYEEAQRQLIGKFSLSLSLSLPLLLSLPPFPSLSPFPSFSFSPSPSLSLSVCLCLSFYFLFP